MMLDLTTTALVKAYLGITAATDDAKIASIVAAANERINIDVPCLGVVSREEVREGDGGTVLVVHYRPLVAITSIEIDGESVSAYSSATGIGYRAQGDIVRIYGGRSYTLGATVALTYTAGVAIAPPLLIHAATEIAASWYKRASRIDESSKSAGGQETISYRMDALPSAAVSAIKSYMLSAMGPL